MYRFLVLCAATVWTLSAAAQTKVQLDGVPGARAGPPSLDGYFRDEAYDAKDYVNDMLVVQQRQALIEQALADRTKPFSLNEWHSATSRLLPRSNRIGVSEFQFPFATVAPALGFLGGSSIYVRGYITF